MHEIVTVQLGNRANYLATHFWNTQESYFTYPTPTDPTPAPSPVDHDINFRPGIGADGSDTYTSRTLIYDLQTNFGGLRRVNALYETLRQDEVVKGLWDGIQQTHTVPPIQPIPYQINLESGLPTSQLHSSDVRYWSDFNRLFYHPRSIVPLSSQSLSTNLNSSDLWSTGVDLYKEVDNEFDILDRDIRPFVEESDSLSAFQILSSVDDNWGGYATSYVEALREEYGKKSIWVWGIEDTRRVERAKLYQRLANSARSLRAISQNASAYVRLSDVPSSLPGYVHLEPSSTWSTSALLCAAIETVTLPTRMRKNRFTQAMNASSFEDTLNTTGNQNIWTLQVRATPDRPSGSDSHVLSNSNTIPTNNGHNSVTDPRIRPTSPHSQYTNPDLQDETDTPEPTHFDIAFTPPTPRSQPTFPSPSTSSHSIHIFAQIESHRSTHPPSTLSPPIPHRPDPYSTSPILSIASNPLLFPLLDSYPSTLFTFPGQRHSPRQISVDAALCTTSQTRGDVLALRDLVVGRAGRQMGLIEQEEQEGMYDELTRVAEAYGFGDEDFSDEEGEDEE